VSLVVAERVCLGFGKKAILEDVDVRIGEHDRIGLCGPNGAGKTTLLRLLAGEQSPDRGQLRTSKNLRIGYLPQDLAVAGGKGVLAFVLDSVPGRAALERALAVAQDQLAQGEPRDGDQAMALASKISQLHERLEHFATHYSEHEAMRILAGLGFVARDRDRDLSELSGGWKMRAVLAALLFQQPDLLLLDEPTNHLDLPSVAWFSAFLRRYPRAFMLISHDREFLNEQIDRVMSFEPEGLRQYAGNYEHYVRQRAEERIVLENKARNLARERDKASEFIERFRAQANKARAVQSRVKALERMEQVETFVDRKVMRFQFPPCERSGGEVVRIRGLRKCYGDHVVLSGIDVNVMRGERIGIIGVNGAGKTTLLRLIAKELSWDAGNIVFGSNVRMGYYAQHHASLLDPDRTVYQEVASQDPSAGQTRVRSLLGAFLFGGDDVDKPTRVLSGGERARVALARLLLAPGNLLLMDEPTNHLDLESSESLADALMGYDGTLMFVSHNRSFVRRLATRIWNVADTLVETYPGTLDEYMESARRGRDLAGQDVIAGDRTAESKRSGDQTRAPVRVERPAEREPVRSSVRAHEHGEHPRDTRAETRERKRLDAEQRNRKSQQLAPLRQRVTALERRIAELETHQKQRSLELADPSVYADGERRRELLDAYRNDAAELEALGSEWEAAQGELESLERN